MMKKYNTHQIFYPSLFSILINPVYFSNKGLLTALYKYADKMKGKLLDFGCGSKPYKPLFTNVSQYIGIDIENEGHDHSNENVDVFYDGKRLPFDDEEFDSVFSSEVLEHVPNIHDSLSEIKRVMKSEGYILLTIPFVYPEHELPNDFRRCTINGVRQIFEDLGFEIISIEKIGTFLEVLTELFALYLFNMLIINNRGGGGG